MGLAERDAGGSWTVNRQDDHGNRFVVRAGLAREEAARLAAELEARGHKQLYWVEAEQSATRSPGDQPPDA